MSTRGLIQCPKRRPLLLLLLLLLLRARPRPMHSIGGKGPKEGKLRRQQQHDNCCDQTRKGCRRRRRSTFGRLLCRSPMLQHAAVAPGPSPSVALGPSK